MVGALEDPRRSEPTGELGEREMLEGWLEFHRTTLLLKCEGLDDAQRKARPVPTSLLSLHGLVRHLAEVERGWFHNVLLDGPRASTLWGDEEDEDSEMAPLDDADWDRDRATWLAECEASRQVAAPRSLDDSGVDRRDGARYSLRWIYTHMIEEYARHNGHADLIRELLDGSAGW
jgi:uncharacterized damage-inducible protein DinB